MTTLSLYLNEEPWRARAACVDLPTDIFFPGGGHSLGERAKRVCRGCPVKLDCLHYAVSFDCDHGIWGATNSRDRRRIRRRAA